MSHFIARTIPRSRITFTSTATAHKLYLACYSTNFRPQRNNQITSSSLVRTKLCELTRIAHQTASESPRKMSSASTSDPAITAVLDFWFGLEPNQWFKESEKFDQPITERFGHLVEKARLTDELDSTWLSTPAGSLAMIILLDQFTRNIFRPGNHPNPGLSWSGDAKALRIAAQSIAKGYDKEIQKAYTSHSGKGVHHRYFFYMPFMHAEDLSSQVASCALFENLKHEVEVNSLRRQLAGEEETEQDKNLTKWMNMAVPFAEQHRNCVAEIGRFPKRNEHLGRDTTEAEKQFLEEHPAGF